MGLVRLLAATAAWLPFVALALRRYGVMTSRRSPFFLDLADRRTRYDRNSEESLGTRITGCSW